MDQVSELNLDQFPEALQKILRGVGTLAAPRAFKDAMSCKAFNTSRLLRSWHL